MVISEHGDFEAVHGDNFHHTASRGDADERMLLARILQGQTVGIRMLITGVHRLDANPDASLLQCLWRTWQSLVRRVLTQQAAK